MSGLLLVWWVILYLPLIVEIRELPPPPLPPPEAKSEMAPLYMHEL